MKLGTLAACLSLALGTSAFAQTTTLKIGYATTKESHYGVGSTVFCDEVEKGTQGRYKCQHFPNSALGGERAFREFVVRHPNFMERRYLQKATEASSGETRIKPDNYDPRLRDAVRGGRHPAPEHAG